MKKPYIENYGDKMAIDNGVMGVYNQESQVSFENELGKIKMIKKGGFGSTIETSTIENSDLDELYEVRATKLTETIEESDPDEYFLF